VSRAERFRFSEAMVFFSNGQNESSPSADSSGSDSDSQEKRFYAKINHSQRQQSSSTSDSSSDSEPEQVSTRRAAEKPAASPEQVSTRRAAEKPAASPEQVSTRPAAEKPAASPEQVSTRPAAEKLAASPSPKKKPDASDRSAVRNQTTPSEPNPNLPSASKLKRAAATKRAKDDDFAEEQPEPKKKSVSKGKKSVEEEVAKDDGAAEAQTELKKKSVSKGKKSAEVEVPASNPTKKKPRKQPQESAAAVLVATPSSKDSPQKSSKKTAHPWTDEDESVIMQGYLVCAKEGLEFPKNMPQLLEKINDSLVHEANKSQLYEKLRRMKVRYESIKNKMAQGNIKEDLFAYKSSHEKELYKLWKQAWGEQPEGDEVDVEPAGDAMEVDITEAVGDDTRRAGEEQITAGDRGEGDAEEEEEAQSDAGTDTVKEPKTPSTEKVLVSNHISAKAPVSNHIPAKAPVSSPMPNDKPEDRLVYETLVYETLRKETRGMMAEVTRDVKEMAETSEAELKAYLDSRLSSANGTRGTGGGSGRRINSAVWSINRESGLDGIYSLRELPPLDEARVQMLEGKWREVQILETEASLKRYAILQEECSAHLKSLKTSKGNARS